MNETVCASASPQLSAECGKYIGGGGGGGFTWRPFLKKRGPDPHFGSIGCFLFASCDVRGEGHVVAAAAGSRVEKSHGITHLKLIITAVVFVFFNS